MKIVINRIPPDGFRITKDESAKMLDLKSDGVEFNDPINIDIFANKAGNTILIGGKLKTKIGLICSRCLKKIEQPLENVDFNINRDTTGEKEIDITDNIREEIIVMLPTKPLCNEQCKGLCPNCGQDLNKKECVCKKTKTDIRWGGLNGLVVE